MAVVIVAAFYEFFPLQRVFAEAANLEFGPWVDQSTREIFAVDLAFAPADVTDESPIIENPVAIDGYRALSFLDDYYNRVHVLPQTIALGNLLTTQIRELEIWNAHFEPKLLSGIDESGTDGMVLTDPTAPPTIFAELESRIYTLNISTNGAPVIAARYIFLFPDESPSVVVSGRRVVVWPFMPQTEFRETLEWATDILTSFNKEQRIALRAAPRQGFSHSYQLDERQYSRARAITSQWAHRVYGVPVWAEATHLGAIPAGTSNLAFDTRNADYRQNDIVLLWESDTKFEAIETLAKTDGGIALKLPTEVTFVDAFVTPLRFARTRLGMDYKRSAHHIVKAGTHFQVTINADLGTDIGYTKYRGKDVLLERQVLLGDLNERISRAVDEQDNGAGPVAVDTQSAYITHAQTITFDLLDRESRWKIRKWLHARRGKQRAFWLPSWNPDLLLIDPVGPETASITVSPIGYPLYYGARDIMVELKSGARYFNRVLSAVIDANLNETLQLSGSFGVAFNPADVERICFMTHVRLNSDTIEIGHSFAGRSSITIPVVETPQ